MRKRHAVVAHEYDERVVAEAAPLERIDHHLELGVHAVDLVEVPRQIVAHAGQVGQMFRQFDLGRVRGLAFGSAIPFFAQVSKPSELKRLKTRAMTTHGETAPNKNGAIQIVISGR